MGVIQRQSLKNLVSAYAGIALGFISLFILQPRFLTAEELGLTRILYSFSFLIATFVPFGINNITFKFFPAFNDPEKGHRGYVGFAILVTLAGLCFGYALLWLTKGWVMSAYEYKSKLFVQYYSCVFPLITFFALTNTLTAYFFVRLKTTVPPFINDVLMRILVVALVVIYHFDLISFNYFIYFFTAIYALQLIMLVCYLYYVERPQWKIDWPYFREQSLKKMFGYGIILWTGTLAAVGLKELATLMLGRFMSLEYVAVYAIASFIPTVIEAPMSALEKIAGARISFAWKEQNKIEISSIYHKSVKYLLLIGGLLFIGINTNISNFLSFLPAKYSEGAPVIFIISLSSLFNMATGLNNAILLYSHRYKPGALLLVILVILNFTLQLLLVPHFGLIGAAIGTALSQIIFNVTNFLLVWRYFKLQPLDKSTLLILGMIGLCFLVNFIIPVQSSVIVDMIVRSVTVTAIYLGATIYFKLVPELYEFLPWKGKS